MLGAVGQWNLEERLEALSQRKPGVPIAAALIYPDRIEAAHRNCEEDSRFQIGSISKVLTAELLCRAVAENRCQLDDPVSKWLPQGTRVPKYLGKPISLRNLATHTSGLPRLPLKMFLKDVRSPQPYITWDREKLLTVLSHTFIERFPGTTLAYSNFGFAVLGLALEEIFGQPYRTLIAQMTASLGCPGLRMDDGSDAELEVHGHLSTGAPAPTWELSAFSPAGGCWSTIGDLAKFVQAHVSSPGDAMRLATAEVRSYRTQGPAGSGLPRAALLGLGAFGFTALVPSSWFVPMLCVEFATFGGGMLGGSIAALGWEAASMMNGAPTSTLEARLIFSVCGIVLGAYATRATGRKDMALGWHIGRSKGEQVFWHNGMTAGFSSYVSFCPATRSGVAVLAGQAGFADLNAELAR
jgi:CubicO group peptidase (beta-lactamase class C family)